MAGLSEPAFEKLIKLMQMTQASASDNERLNAVKMANMLLKAADYNWEDLLRGRVLTFPTDTPDLSKAKSTKRYDNQDEINGYFDKVLHGARPPQGGFREFVDSLHDFWQQKGFLTEAQYNAIKKSALRS